MFFNIRVLHNFWKSKFLSGIAGPNVVSDQSITIPQRSLLVQVETLLLQEHSSAPNYAG